VATASNRWTPSHFSAVQLWRLHLLALITPVHSFNLLVRLLPEQKAWRRFARLCRLDQLPDVRTMNAFREEVGVSGLRQINSHLLDPLIENLDPTRPALALIDATDLPATCSGFEEKFPTAILAPGRSWRSDSVGIHTLRRGDLIDGPECAETLARA